MAIHDGGNHPCILLLLLQFLVGSVVAHSAPPLNLKSSVDRTSFPKGFIFGAASSSYQYEGGAKEGGRGPSIWDTFTHKYPHKIADGQNGDVAIDSYNRYKEDVANLKEIGFDAYRFSISWSRILPNGKLKGGVNPEGIKYYDNLINELLQNGIQPYVTLFHWDLPQALEDEYGGFLGEKIVDDFRDYAGVCFKHFGDRVKNWITLNEPHTYSNLGYAIGSFAPGHCTDWQKLNCTTGDSGTEPYIVSHNFLLAHAAAFELYRKKYKRKQQGDIGITLVSGWFIPNSEQSSDKDAVQRAIDFMFGWYMDPLTSGDYPKSMRSLLGNRLPKFTKHQSNLVKGSFDFLGLNYYTTNYATNDPRCGYNRGSYTTDSCAILSGKRNEVPIGPTVAASWLYVYPKGLYELLTYIKKKYNNPIIYITENGVSDLKKDLSVDEALADTVRIDYYDQHLSALRDAIHKEKVQVKGYFAWSLMDNFEWADGYTVRFGLIYVDYNHGLVRYSKQSAHWFRKFLKTQTTHAKEHTLDKDGVPLKDPQEL